MIQERNHEYEDLFRDHRTHAIASRARLYKQTYVNTMMALLPALMKAAPQISATVAHETLVLGPGFTFAIDIDGFGRAITFEQHGSSWRVAADKEPDFVIEFRDLDYAFEVFSGGISLKEALAARLVRHPWR